MPEIVPDVKSFASKSPTVEKVRSRPSLPSGLEEGHRGQNLEKIESIDLSGLDPRVKESRFEVAGLVNHCETLDNLGFKRIYATAQPGIPFETLISKKYTGARLQQIAAQILKEYQAQQEEIRDFPFRNGHYH